MSVVAYLDPGTGSLIAASAAAGVAGMGMAAKAIWSKQTSRFRKSGPEDAVEDSTEDDVMEPGEAVNSPVEQTADTD